MNKPSWDSAPYWAKWLAQDKDGEYCWWNIKPLLACSLWVQGSPEEDYIFVSAGYFTKNESWKETLEQRP